MNDFKCKFIGVDKTLKSYVSKPRDTWTNTSDGNVEIPDLDFYQGPKPAVYSYLVDVNS